MHGLRFQGPPIIRLCRSERGTPIVTVTMSKMSALAYAEHGPFSQIRAFAGDVLYTERMPAEHLYVIKDGEVDLYLVRDEKRTVIETLKRGQCFGIAPHLNAQRRVHNAAARTYCELYLIGTEAVGAAIDACPDLARSLLETMSARLAVAHELIATRVNYRSDMQIYAQMLYLLGIAEVGLSAVRGRSAQAGGAPVLARPLLQDVVTQARLMFGHSDRHIHGCLARLAGLHVLRIDDERGTGKQVIFSPRDIVSQVQRFAGSGVHDDKLSYEYIGIDEFAELVDVERGMLLRKLAAGEFAQDIFTFRRAEILRVLDTHGKRYFSERRIKKPEEFTELADLEFADSKSIFAVVSRLDSFDIAKMLSLLPAGPARDKVLGSLSQRRRDEVESDLSGLDAVDPVEAQQIGGALIGEVKELMLAR